MKCQTLFFLKKNVYFKLSSTVVVNRALGVKIELLKEKNENELLHMRPTRFSISLD